MKTFTVEEADSLIPQLEPVLAEMIELRDQLAETYNQVQAQQRLGGNGGNHSGGKYLTRMQHLNALVTVVQDLGCELKDLDKGLVDFPSMRDGELIYLCWELGEKRIGFWHTIEGGYAGRQPL
jgi:hypothetical protein